MKETKQKQKSMLISWCIILGVIVPCVQCNLGLRLTPSVGVDEIRYYTNVILEVGSYQATKTAEVAFNNEISTIGEQSVPMIMSVPFTQFRVNGSSNVLNIWDMVTKTQEVTMCQFKKIYRGGIIENGCASNLNGFDGTCDALNQCSFTAHVNGDPHLFYIDFHISNHVLSNHYSSCTSLYVTKDDVPFATIDCASGIEFMGTNYSILSAYNIKGTYQFKKNKDGSHAIGVFPETAEYDTIFLFLVITGCVYTSSIVLKLKEVYKLENVPTMYYAKMMDVVTCFVLSTILTYAVSGTFWVSVSHADVIVHGYISQEMFEAALWFHTILSIVIFFYCHKILVWLIWTNNPRYEKLPLWVLNWAKKMNYQNDLGSMRKHIIVFCDMYLYVCIMAIYIHMPPTLGNTIREFFGFLLGTLILIMIGTDAAVIISYFGVPGVIFTVVSLGLIWIIMFLPFVESVRTYPSDSYELVSLVYIFVAFTITVYVTY